MTWTVSLQQVQLSCITLPSDPQGSHGAKHWGQGNSRASERLPGSCGQWSPVLYPSGSKVRAGRISSSPCGSHLHPASKWSSLSTEEWMPGLSEWP